MGKIFLLLFMQVQFFSIWSTYFFGYFPYFPGFIIKISFVCFELYWGEKTWNFLNFIHLSMIFFCYSWTIRCVCVWLHAFFFSRCFFFKKGHRLAHHLSFVNYIHTLARFLRLTVYESNFFSFFLETEEKSMEPTICQMPGLCVYVWLASIFFLHFFFYKCLYGRWSTTIHTHR